MGSNRTFWYNGYQMVIYSNYPNRQIDKNHPELYLDLDPYDFFLHDISE